MQVFINELSLQGQYHSDEAFTGAVQQFMAIFALLNERVREKQVYKTQIFLTRQAIHNEAFQASFQRILNQELKIAFRAFIFNKLSPKEWLNERLHSPDDIFQCPQHSEEWLEDSSVAELAERKLQDSLLVGLLVNFSGSTFARFPILEVVKNEQVRVNLDGVSEQAEFVRWLEKNPSLLNYSLASKDPPRDEQTILVSATRFVLKTQIVQGRKIYRELNTGYYWYVDNFHSGASAHLEVFDNTGRHLGEADLQGNINLEKRDPAKTINIA